MRNVVGVRSCVCEKNRRCASEMKEKMKEKVRGMKEKIWRENGVGE